MWGAQNLWAEGTAVANRRHLNRAGFDAALHTVLERYVDPVDASPVLAESLKRVVSGLDSYSHFLTADERDQIRQRSRGGSLRSRIRRALLVPKSSQCRIACGNRRVAAATYRSMKSSR